MINHKIKDDLLDRAKPSPSHEAQILFYLSQNKNKVVSLVDIANASPKRSGSIWGAAYNLALEGKIGYADRRYHIFATSSHLKDIPKSKRIMVWHHDFNVSVNVRPRYATAQRDQILDTPTPVQQSLFDPDFEAMETQEIDRLLKRLQAIKLTREINDRYDGAPTKHRAALTRILSDYGVSDPVALVHAGEDLTFLTLTATTSMPIQVTLKRNGFTCETMYLEHITLYNAPVIGTIQEAYKQAAKRGT